MISSSETGCHACRLGRERRESTERRLNNGSTYFIELFDIQTGASVLRTEVAARPPAVVRAMTESTNARWVALGIMWERWALSRTHAVIATASMLVMILLLALTDNASQEGNSSLIALLLVVAPLLVVISLPIIEPLLLSLVVRQFDMIFLLANMIVYTTLALWSYSERDFQSDPGHSIINDSPAFKFARNCSLSSFLHRQPATHSFGTQSVPEPGSEGW